MPPTLPQLIANLINIDDVPHDKNFTKTTKIHKYWSRKPWFVIDKYLDKYSAKGSRVLDPFCGSGIVGLQSVLAGREFIGYDLNPFASFLSRDLVDVAFDAKTFADELACIEHAIGDEIMSLYEIDGKFILYTILGPKNQKPYNGVIAGRKFDLKQKVVLPEEALRPQIVFPKGLKYPDKPFPKNFYKDRFSYKGVKKVSDMFTSRNLLALAKIYNAITTLPLKHRNQFMLALTNSLLHVSKLKSESIRPLGVNNYWIPDDFIEENVWWRFIDRANSVKIAKGVISERARKNSTNLGTAKLYNKSSLPMLEIEDRSVDYVFTDPPYGDTIQYSELSFIWNCWLGIDFETADEVVINPAQKKGMQEYRGQLLSFISEVKRVLKSGAHFTLAFQNKDLSTWIELAKLIRATGMELVDISCFNTVGSPYNKHWAKFSPKTDFYVTFKNQDHGQYTAANTKTIRPEEIASDIVEHIADKRNSLFQLNKGYDLFVGMAICMVFEGHEIADYEKLNVKSIIGLFENLVPNDNGVTGQLAWFE